MRIKAEIKRKGTFLDFKTSSFLKRFYLFNQSFFRIQVRGKISSAALKDKIGISP
jgi:hypothetical protein